MRRHYHAIWLFLRVLLRAIWGHRIEGAEKIPRHGGMILAVNHSAYADPVVAGTGVPRELHYFAKRELFRNRAFGALIA